MVDYTSEIKSILRNSSDLTLEQMDAVANDTNIASLGIDSLSLVEAIIEMEKKFKLDIELGGPWMDEANISINDINKMINEKIDV
jgi:acyl carrier protein